jgi:hypothetical protein
MATFELERKRPHDEGSDQEPEPFKPLLKTRAESYELEVPNTDWVLSLTAPTHVATSRASFTTYEPWQSMVRFGKTGTHAVVGIGTASFEALLKPDSDQITKMSVREVLHIPGLMSNIFSITRVITRGFSVSLDKPYAIITKVNTNTRLYATWYEGLYRLALPGPSIRPSKLCEGDNHVLAFDWPMAERHAWESSEARKRQVDQEQQQEIDTITKKRASASPESNPAIANQADVYRCKGCNRKFTSGHSLNNHRRDKNH